MSTISVSITLPASILVRTVAGKAINLEVSKLPAEVIARVFEGGAKVILTNAFNGGGRELPEADKLAQLQKRMDAWYKGEYVVVERENGTAAMKEAYVDETKARTGQTTAQVEKDMSALVAKRFGEKEKAAFSTFLKALAAEIGAARDMDAAEVEQKLQAKYARLAQEAAERRAAASSKIDMSAISLD